MIVSLIVAMSENRVIGRDGGMPWRLSADLRRFRTLTMGHTIVMGRRTWESIGRLLPGRKTVIISRNPAYIVEGAATVDNLNDALRTAAGDSEVFVVGGGEIYRLAIPIANRIYITRVLSQIDGDTTFPEVNWLEWTRIESEAHSANEKNNHDFVFETWIRNEVSVYGSDPFAARQNQRERLQSK